MKQPYHKTALSFEQQIAHLQHRGMQFNDIANSIQQLSCINYYRLSGYWYPFREINEAGEVGNQFTPNTHFEAVLALYEFDRKLRSLVLDGIERVEIAVRTQFAFHIGHTYGPLGHTNPTHFHPKFDHATWLSKLREETNRSNDEFVRHFKNKYIEFPDMPIWMLTEVMSLGGLSLGYKGLRNDKRNGVEDKYAISSHFGLHHKQLESWLHALTYVRNVCAHHSRLWNRELAIRPDRSKDPHWRAPVTPRNDRIFYILLVLRTLLKAIGVGEHWAQNVNELIAPLALERRWRVAMGLPEHWREHPLWI